MYLQLFVDKYYHFFYKSDQIIQSIDNRLFSQLPPETLVLPGHGNDTTIANESPFLEEWASRGW